MNTIAAACRIDAQAFLPARLADEADIPWVPLSTGKSFKPLRFFSDNRGFVELLRLEPGQTIPLHRHTGEVHAFNLSGAREICTGEQVGPGGYVYEPAGNADSWKVVGNEPLLVLVVVYGAVEYLDADGRVVARYTADTLFDLYHRHCEEHGIAPLDLID